MIFPNGSESLGNARRIVTRVLREIRPVVRLSRGVEKIRSTQVNLHTHFVHRPVTSMQESPEGVLWRDGHGLPHCFRVSLAAPMRILTPRKSRRMDLRLWAGEIPAMVVLVA